MRNLILSFSVLALVACGGNSNNAAPADPSTTGQSAGTKPENQPASTSTAATGASDDGKCSTTTTTSASSADACKADCEKLSDKAPEGSRCLPPRTSCKMACDHQFKK